jgi:hypothetical protein
VTRKLLPLLRTQLLKEDKLSISGPGIMTVVIRSEQQGAELVAQRIQETVQAMTVHLRGRQTKVKVAYSSLTFALKANNRSMTVSPLLKEAMIAAQMPGSEGNL